jgi:pantoate kinase
MKKTAKAFAPGNISLLFGVIPGVDARSTGSVGVGCTVDEGATVTVSVSDAPSVTYNGKHIDLPTVTEAVKELTNLPMSVSISTPLPLGSGFGMSGASALAASYAINELLHLGKTPLMLAKVAHTAEVVSKTGLGDVANEYYGGFFVKFVTSARFIVQKLPVTDTVLYCISHGKLLTSSILSDAVVIKKINAEARLALTEVKALLSTRPSLSFGDIVPIANRFTKKTGLLSAELAREIDAIEKKGGHAAMILLGNAIASDIPFDGSMKLHLGHKKATLL